MPVYALGDDVPDIHPDAYVHPDAVVIGKVTIGAEASIWPGAILRGDERAGIVVGARSSVQDGCVLHCTDDLPTVVGEESVLGHIVHLEGCTIEDRALVGNGAIVLHRAVVRTWGLVGSNAVVPQGMEVPARAMALGVPARLRPDSVEDWMIIGPMLSYVERGRRYRADMRRVD